MPTIHPSSLVDPGAELCDDVEVGPWCEVEAGAYLGPGSILESRVKVGPGVVLGASTRVGSGSVIHSGTRAGDRNHFSEGTVVGANPLTHDLTGPFGTLEIGSDNTIREYTTIQVGNQPGLATRMGDHNLILARVQIGHDCILGNHIVASNNLILCGHIEIEDHAVFGVGVSVHQFCRIGSYVMVGASSYLSQDVPPFCLVDGKSGKVVGLNRVGLRRKGFQEEEISTLKRAYRLLYHSKATRDEILRRLEEDFSGEWTEQLRQFLAHSGSRGIVQTRRKLSN